MTTLLAQQNTIYLEDGLVATFDNSVSGTMVVNFRLEVQPLVFSPLITKLVLIQDFTVPFGWWPVQGGVSHALANAD